jgi:hypothetical protein
MKARGINKYLKIILVSSESNQPRPLAFHRIGKSRQVPDCSSGFFLGQTELVMLVQVHPKLRARPEETTRAQGRVARYGALPYPQGGQK